MHGIRSRSKSALVRDLQSAYDRIAELEALCVVPSPPPPVSQSPEAYLVRRCEAGYAIDRISEDIRDITGFSPEDFTASRRFWDERIHPDDRLSVLACLTKSESGGGASPEYRFRLADGTYRAVREELRLVGRGNGQHGELIGALRLCEGISSTERPAAPEHHAVFDAALTGASPGSVANLPDKGVPDLKNLFDRQLIQSMMHDFQKLTGAVFALLDLDGNVLVASGWQDICTKFHRIHPISAGHCRQSDLFLTKNVRRGEYVAYKCQNMLWDVVTPLYIGDRHMGNIYTGQFFYDDEDVDTTLFAAQAANCGFDRMAYLDALSRVPRVSRERIKVLIDFLLKFTSIISELGARNLRLINAVAVSRRVAGALRESERHFRQLATQAPVPIAIFDASGTVETLNDRFVTTFGYTPESVPTLAVWWQKAFPDPAARAVAAQCWERDLNRPVSPDSRPEEQRITCADGSWRVVETLCSRIGHNSIAIFTDITARKLSEEGLRASEERLKNLYSLSPVGIFLCTTQGKYLSVNHALANILGYDSVTSIMNDVICLPEQTFHDPEEWKDIVSELETKGKFVNRLVRRKKRDGSRIWVLMNMRAVRAADRSISHFEGFTLDISERMKANQALRDSEERLRTLIDAMPDMVCFKDGQGRWLEANDFTQRLFDLDSMAYLGRTDRELARQSSEFRDVFELCAVSDDLAWHTGKMFRGEEAMLRRDGNLLVFDIIKVPLFRPDGSRRGLVVVGRDITKQREASTALARFNRKLESLVADRTRELEQKAGELEAANARLLELDAVKSAFVSAVSHEVRTPLTSILGFARLIERDFRRHYLPLGEQDRQLSGRGERIVENLRIINREGDRLKRLISDFLDLAKIECGSLQWHDVRLPLRELIDQVTDAVRGMFSEHPGVAFVLDVASDLPNLCIDPDRMLQVLLNLIGNAIKFTLSGTITLRVAMQTENILGISVADTGIGIRSEDLERIFEKFHQVHQGNTVFEQAKGTGLGLTICRQIVRHYGGAIWAESDPGGGSVFRITLPVRAEGDGCGAGTPPGEPVC